MNVRDLLQDCYLDLGYQTAPDLAVQQRLTNYLNKAYLHILREPSLSRLRDTLTSQSLTTVSGQAIYGLPAAITRITAITDRTNNRLLTAVALADLRRTDPGLTATGTPWAFVPLGRGVTAMEIASTGLWAVSSSSSDTTQTVQLSGTRTGGLPTGDVTATLTGTTRVAVGSFTDYVNLTSFTLSATAVGAVSLYDASSSGNLIATIPIGATTASYLRVQFYPEPDAAITYYVDGPLAIQPLADGQDVPLLPEEFHDLLSTGALMAEYQRKDDQKRYGMMAREYEDGLSRLKHFVATSPSETPVMGRPARRRWSPYGAWAPADTP